MTTNTFKKLAQGQLAASAGVLYTVPGATQAIVKSIVLDNTTGSTQTVSAYVDGTGASNRIGSLVIPAGGNATWTSQGWTVRDANGSTMVTTQVTLTGDVIGTGPGSVPTILATVNANVGTFGNATNVMSQTVDAKGRTLAASNVPIQIPTSQVTGFDTQVRTSRLDQMATPTATVSMGSQIVSNVATPVSANDAVNKAYADALAAGLRAKPSVNSANTSGNITLVGAQTIDGIAGTAGVTRTLLTSQTLPVQNGIWVQQVAAWTRPTDFTTGSEAAGSFVFVEGGTINTSSGWVVTGEPPITVDTTNQTWTQFSGAGEVLPGNSMTKSGNTLNVTTTPATQTAVGATRTINTTAPITGGGDLSADRTLALTTSPAGQTPVGVTRNIGTTAPITGGGPLSADLTLALTTSPTGQTPVGVTRNVNTTAPITGGGNLSADLTLALTTSPAGQTPVGVTRNVNTTAPITGGGPLSADLTLALTTSPTGQTPVGVTRTLTTTAPLTIDGGASADLSANRTLAATNATTTVAGWMSAVDKIRMGGVLDAQADFGFVDDLRGTGDGTCSTGAPTKITSASAAFVAGDNGKRITLAGAGAAAAMYVGTITAIDSATQVTVSPSISTTVTNFALQLGTDNTAAENALLTAVNTTFATYPGLMVLFGRNPGTGRTGRYGCPIQLPFTRPVILVSTGRGFTADTGVADQVGGGWLCWWGTTSDGGTAFSPFISFRSNQNNNMKGSGLRDISVECSNGSQYGAINQRGTNALIGVKLATVNGFSWDNVFIRNAAAIGLWTDIDATPTEQESVSRGMISNLAFRCLDNGPSAMTTPILMTSAVTLTTTPQSLTVAANTLPVAGYFWTATTVGRPVLVNYTGGGGTTTLTGCTVSAEDNILTPVTVNGGNVVEAVPSTSAAAVLSGNTTANTNLSMFQMWQLSVGTTWGPAAIECLNADSVTFQEIVVNGGNGTNDGAINRIRKPGVRFNGHQTTLGLAARNNVFYDGDPGAGGVSNMALLNTGAKMTAPAGPNYWWGVQLGNAAPQPNIEAGGYLEWTANGGVSEGLRSILTAQAQSPTAATLTLVNGSVMLLPPQAFQVGTAFRWQVQMSKTAAGIAARVFHIRVGATGTTADAIVQTFTSGLPTAVAAHGIIEILYNITAIGASATGAGMSLLQHAGDVAGTAIVGLATIPYVQIAGVPTAFNSASSGFLYISLSVTTGAAEALTFNRTTAEILRVGNQGA